MLYQHSKRSQIPCCPTATGAAADQALTDDETLALEILKGTFLEALGEDAIYEIQQRNPKDKLYD